ncbi:MAG: hypothetical protein IKM11_04070 [Oscillospiraceae bacterium]|nr:hypothetical protein [Oscillospiraceae bacterium]
METRRLKNIAIAILLLLNIFLLLLLGYQTLMAHRVERDALEELKVLFASEDLELRLGDHSPGESLTALTLARKTESEASIATFLMGEAVTMSSEGGGIYSYTAQAGTVQFRAGGGFDTVRISRPVGNAMEFMRQFCDKFGYEDIEGDLIDGSGTLTATQHVARVPILGCTIAMVFENHRLVFAAGAHIDLSDAKMESGETLSGVSILVRFFDYRRQEGIVCSEIRDVQCVYQLHSAGNLPRLSPVWIVETDIYRYLVDGISGEVLRG